jgi:hypothetical protein
MYPQKVGNNYIFLVPLNQGSYIYIPNGEWVCKYGHDSELPQRISDSLGSFSAFANC